MRPFLSSNVLPVRDCAEPRQSGGRRWIRACVGVVFAAAIMCVAQDGQPTAVPAAQPNANPQGQAGSPGSAKPVADPLDNPLVTEPTAQPQSPPVSQRRKQISAESTQLLTMAVDLKAEVEKTNKDTLSLNVIRKADAIEKLAKTVKEKMKQGSGPS